MRNDSPLAAQLLQAVHFAAAKHCNQRRKDLESSPYINHPIEVAELLARVGAVDDLVTLQAAILHDTIEDTQTTPDELEAEFGPEVRDVVLEVTDDKSLPKEERKRLQIEHAAGLSPRASKVKVADKIANIRAVIYRPPSEWPLARRRDYLDWTERVVHGLRGCGPELTSHYRALLDEGRALLDALEARSAMPAP